MRSRAPWYARLVGWILLVFGAANVAGLVVAVLQPWGVKVADAALYLALGVLPLVGGVGTILSRRWGWLVSLVAGAAWITYGLLEWVHEGMPFPGDPQAQVDPTTIAFLVLPGLAMLGGLLAPATLRWLRVRPAAT
jgi:hypothetical protein